MKWRPPLEYSINYSNLVEVLLHSTCFLVLFYLLYRRYVFSVIDPLFMFVFLTAFSCVMVTGVVKSPAAIAHFFICQAFLFVGFSFIQQWFRSHPSSIDQPSHIPEVDTLELTCYFLLALYLSANIVLFFAKGFPLLSKNPTIAKVFYFQDGFGLVRRINWGAGGFLTAGLLYLYFVKQHWRFLLFLGFVAALTAMEGSKSSLLRLLFSFSLLAYHPLLKENPFVFNLMKRFVLLTISGIALIFSTVLIRENNTLEAAAFGILKRLVYSGDVVLYYYLPVNQQFFARYSIVDYPAYILDPILGFLRLAPYQQMFGNLMVRNSVPANTPEREIVGPNTPFYIEGIIFFGYYGTLLYSFIIGGIFSAIRCWYFRLTNSTAFQLTFLCYLCQVSTSLLIDIRLTIAMTMDTCMFVLPAYLIARVIISNRKQTTLSTDV